MKNPPKTADDCLNKHAAQGLAQTVNTLRPLTGHFNPQIIGIMTLRLAGILEVDGME
jgi:hypothetical protein